MKDIEQSETFLAKWLANDISEAELKAFKKTEDYRLFSKIADESKGFTRDHLDAKASYKEILLALDQPKKDTAKVIPLFPKWVMPVAVSIALFLGIFYFFNASTTQSSSFGEQLTVMLPDNSEVILNARSKLSYNKNKWHKNRTLNLEGEAYFKVSKGSTFTVRTSEGDVSVLGTQFNMLQDQDFLQVTCFEGKVKVESYGNVVFLTKGKTFKYYKGEVVPEDETTNSQKPDWITGESVFKSVPLHIVLKSLEKQYGIKIKSNIKSSNKLFSGSFLHSNLTQALESVLLPMNISYSFSENKKEIRLQEN